MQAVQPPLHCLSYGSDYKIGNYRIFPKTTVFPPSVNSWKGTKMGNLIDFLLIFWLLNLINVAQIRILLGERGQVNYQIQATVAGEHNFAHICPPAGEEINSEKNRNDIAERHCP